MTTIPDFHVLPAGNGHRQPRPKRSEITLGRSSIDISDNSDQNG
jgi:hypothetical protein